MIVYAYRLRYDKRPVANNHILLIVTIDDLDT